MFHLFTGSISELSVCMNLFIFLTGLHHEKYSNYFSIFTMAS